MRAKDLLKLIPSHVRITNNVTYEVLYSDEIVQDNNRLGECRPYSKQILIKTNQSPTEKFQTFIHEVLHAISFENKHLNLTEKQVRILEKSLYKMLKLNGLLNK